MRINHGMRHYKNTQIVTWRTQGDGDD
eukprot:COSAG06_NODE_43052_length_375_cov_6.619565_1_plen_26_part_10